MTPLILIVGFLGAGKTTYLRALLPELRTRGLDPHVILNDYQNARVDAELLREVAPGVLPISGSCVCCGSQEELLTALGTFEHRPGRIVVLEANGTTDAEGLIELLSLDPELTRFTLPVQLSIVDGQRWQKRFWHNALELSQVRTASYCFVSRREKLDARRSAQVAESFSRHAISAPERAPAAFADDVAAMRDAVQHLSDRGAVAPPHDCGCDDPNHDHHHAHHHHHGDPHHFSSMQLRLPDPVPRAAVERLLAALPAEVVRVKGLARLAESPEEYHVVQRVEDAPPQWIGIGRESRLDAPLLVLIGPRIDETAVRAEAARCFGSADLLPGS